MQAIAKAFSAEARRWAARLHHRRTAGIPLRGHSLFLQQLAWAQALRGRFAHPAGLASGSERTLLRGARAWMLRCHWFAPKIHLAWHTSIATATAWEGRGRTLLLPPGPVMFSERATLLQFLLTREYQRQATTPLSAGVIRNSMHTQLREVTRHTLATMVVERAAAPSAMSLLQGDASTVTRMAGTADPELLPLVKRVLRQNRRIEEQVAPSQTVLLPSSAPRIREPHFMEAGVPPQARPTGVSAAWAATPAPQSFNINQITDEVVRQLDSRLVATRERFGRI